MRPFEDATARRRTRRGLALLAAPLDCGAVGLFVVLVGLSIPVYAARDGILSVG